MEPQQGWRPGHPTLQEPLMDAGWAGLTADEQSSAIYGGVIGGGGVMVVYTLFGFRYLRRQWRTRKRHKVRARRRR
jgi:hypothetical protein